MRSRREVKYRRLKEAGLLNSVPDRVIDQLFRDFPEFFDSEDMLQVRYEMLRRHLVDGKNVVAVCKTYGVSRQTFYNALEKFSEQGSAGLLPQKPGPKGARKLKPDVLKFARRELKREPTTSGSELASRIEEKFGLSIHKRTIEKLLRDLRSKKNY
jgi:transposase